MGGDASGRARHRRRAALAACRASPSLATARVRRRRRRPRPRGRPPDTIRAEPVRGPDRSCSSADVGGRHDRTCRAGAVGVARARARSELPQRRCAAARGGARRAPSVPSRPTTRSRLPRPAATSSRRSGAGAYAVAAGRGARAATRQTRATLAADPRLPPGDPLHPAGRRRDGRARRPRRGRHLPEDAATAGPEGPARRLPGPARRPTSTRRSSEAERDFEPALRRDRCARCAATG